MKADLATLQATFTLGYDSYLASRNRAEQIHDMFHNRQYSEQQQYELESAGRPKETFNVIKLFTRQLTGYYSTMYNTVRVNPVQYQDINVAALLNDVMAYIDRKNQVDAINERIRLDCFLTGLMVHHTKATPKLDREGAKITDQYGRVAYDIIKQHIPAREIILDPMSKEPDSTDARFIHRWRWITQEEMETMFSKSKVAKLDAYNSTIATAVFDPEVPFQNIYADLDNYLVVHSVLRIKDKVYSIYWTGDEILTKTDITHNYVKFPYQVVKLQDSYEAEYYGIFEDVVESQNAINQALTQIQLLANSNKVVVRTGAVKEEDWEDFKRAIVRVNAVLELDEPDDVTILNMSGDIAQQYMIVDSAFNRIQRVLGINDSFLGQAFASDSGRKVKLQQNATTMALRYIDTKLDLLFRLVGNDTLWLIQQYMRSDQIIRIVDETVGERWIAINQPLIDPQTAQPIYHEEVDPETGDLLQDEYGNYILTPLNVQGTDLEFADVDIELTSVAYNDEDEKNQLMLETMLSGNIGLMLQQYNPAGYMKASSLVVKSMKSRHSQDIMKILDETAQLIAPQQPGGGPVNEGQQLGGQTANSQQLKLPQNTNEEY